MNPINDATPLGGGACANNSNRRDDRTRLLLFPPAHHNAPPGTSHVAARRIAGYAPAQRELVMCVIRDAGEYGATDAEIEAVTGFRPSSITPRRGELRTLGQIVDSGRRRNTPRERPATVWVACEYAQGGAA